MKQARCDEVNVVLSIIVMIVVMIVIVVIGIPTYFIIQTKLHNNEVDTTIAKRYALLAPLLNETAEDGIRKLMVFVLDEPVDVLDVYLEVFLRQQTELQEAYRNISLAASSDCTYNDYEPLVKMSIVIRAYQVVLDRLLKSVARLGVNCGYRGPFSTYSMFDTMHSCSLYETNPSFMANAMRPVPN